MMLFGYAGQILKVDLSTGATNELPIQDYVDRFIGGRGLAATGHGPEMVEQGLAIVTGLVPKIGYDLAADIAHEAARTGKTIREISAASSHLQVYSPRSY